MLTSSMTRSTAMLSTALCLLSAKTPAGEQRAEDFVTNGSSALMLTNSTAAAPSLRAVSLFEQIKDRSAKIQLQALLLAFAPSNVDCSVLGEKLGKAAGMCAVGREATVPSMTYDLSLELIRSVAPAFKPGPDEGRADRGFASPAEVEALAQALQKPEQPSEILAAKALKSVQERPLAVDKWLLSLDIKPCSAAVLECVPEAVRLFETSMGRKAWPMAYAFSKLYNKNPLAVAEVMRAMRGDARFQASGFGETELAGAFLVAQAAFDERLSGENYFSQVSGEQRLACIRRLAQRVEFATQIVKCATKTPPEAGAFDAALALKLLQDSSLRRQAFSALPPAEQSAALDNATACLHWTVSDITTQWVMLIGQRFSDQALDQMLSWRQAHLDAEKAGR